jgi:hypothetical protein
MDLPVAHATRVLVVAAVVGVSACANQGATRASARRPQALDGAALREERIDCPLRCTAHSARGRYRGDGENGGNGETGGSGVVSCWAQCPEAGDASTSPPVPAGD